MMEISTNAVIDLTGADSTIPITVSKTSQFFEILESLNLRMLPNEYVTWTFTTTGSGDLLMGIGWSELF